MEPEPSASQTSEEPRLILGVPGVGAGLLARSSVEWLVDGELDMEATRVRSELEHWLEHPLPGKYFGVMYVHDDELVWFRTLIQRAGWTWGAPDDVKELQLAVARGDG